MKKSFKIIAAVLLLSSIVFSSKFIISCSKEQSGDVVNEPKKDSTNNSKISDGVVVGKIINGEFVITADKEELLSDFSKMAYEQGLGNVVYESISIVKKELMDNGKIEYYYGLYASDKDFKYNSAISLKLDGSNFELDTLSGGGTITCQSVGCGTACAPYKKKVNGGSLWTCSECSNPCTKTMSANLP